MIIFDISELFILNRSLESYFAVLVASDPKTRGFFVFYNLFFMLITYYIQINFTHTSLKATTITRLHFSLYLCPRGGLPELMFVCEMGIVHGCFPLFLLFFTTTPAVRFCTRTHVRPCHGCGFRATAARPWVHCCRLACYRLLLACPSKPNHWCSSISARIRRPGVCSCRRCGALCAPC